MENGRKRPILVIPEDLYRYSLDSGNFWSTCTGTGQSCTGTPCSVLTSFRILAITFSFLSDLSDSSG